MADIGDSNSAIAGIFEWTGKLVAENWMLLLGLTTLLTALFTFSDVLFDLSTAALMYTVTGFIALYVQLVVVVYLARRTGLLKNKSHENGSPSLGLYIRVVGQSIVFGFGVFLGLLFLVLPGLWLLSIWFMCLPALVVENEDIMSSLGRSKALADTSPWSVALIAVGIALWFVGAIAVVTWFFPDPANAALIPYFIANFVIQLVQTAGWVFALAAYIHLSKIAVRDGMRDVFA